MRRAPGRSHASWAGLSGLGAGDPRTCREARQVRPAMRKRAMLPGLPLAAEPAGENGRIGEGRASLATIFPSIEYPNWILDRSDTRLGGGPRMDGPERCGTGSCARIPADPSPAFARIGCRAAGRPPFSADPSRPIPAGRGGEPLGHSAHASPAAAGAPPQCAAVGPAINGVCDPPGAPFATGGIRAGSAAPGPHPDRRSHALRCLS